MMQMCNTSLASFDKEVRIAWLHFDRLTAMFSLQFNELLNSYVVPNILNGKGIDGIDILLISCFDSFLCLGRNELPIYGMKSCLK